MRTLTVVLAAVVALGVAATAAASASRWSADLRSLDQRPLCDAARHNANGSFTLDLVDGDAAAFAYSYRLRGLRGPPTGLEIRQGFFEVGTLVHDVGATGTTRGSGSFSSTAVLELLTNDDPHDAFVRVYTAACPQGEVAGELNVVGKPTKYGPPPGHTR